MKVYLSLRPEQIKLQTGIGQIVAAQYKYLPDFGIQFVDDPNDADIIACHIGKGNLPRVDVLHLHGLYYQDTIHHPYNPFHYRINKEIIEASREAQVITVPSEWIAYPFQRDMRINPRVIPHGLDLGVWKTSENAGYILYNKNREGDVCDSTPAWELAKRKMPVVSTFSPFGKEIPPTMLITGVFDWEKMIPVIQTADIYLATTLETFGIGTVEALAAGVPVLGYDWGGTSDLIQHKVNGYLVAPGDIDGLMAGVEYIHAHRAEMSKAAIQSSKLYSWDRIIKMYAEVYQQALDAKKNTKNSVSIVITNHNYSQWVGAAIESVMKQADPPEEIIVVDDGSTDNSLEVIKKYEPNIKLITQQNQGVASARTAGAAAAGGEFITFLDADDLLHPAFVGVLRTALAADRGLGIVYSGIGTINDTGAIITSLLAWPPPFDWNIQSKSSIPPSNCVPSACMIRRDMWLRAGPHKQQYAPGEDAEFWVRGLSIGFRAKKASDDALFQYRLHAGSASREKKYVRIDDQMPWMRDKDYPMGAPVEKETKVVVRSYVRPYVSVIIPVGPGHVRFLPSALDSLLSQTLREWEVIVVDDSGGDFESNQDILRPYPFIKVIKTPGKKGAGFSRNRGLLAAKAPAILFLDADDLLTPTALERMVEAHTKTGKYVYTDWYRVDESGSAMMVSKDYDQHDPNMQHPVTVLMDKAQALELMFDEKMNVWEDWDFFVRAQVRGFCGIRLAEPLFVYRLSSGARRNGAYNQDGSRSQAALDTLTGLNQKYGKYFNGDTAMANCCGGSDAANEIIKIKRLMGNIRKEEETVQIMQDPFNPYVRMQYIGDKVGSMSYVVNNHTYRGGNNPISQYADVYKEDVSQMVASGNWKVVNFPQQAAQAPDQDNMVGRIAAEPYMNQQRPAAPALRIKTAQEIQDEARTSLEKAKLLLKGMEDIPEGGPDMTNVFKPNPAIEPNQTPAAPQGFDDRPSFMDFIPGEDQSQPQPVKPMYDPAMADLLSFELEPGTEEVQPEEPKIESKSKPVVKAQEKKSGKPGRPAAKK